MTARRRCVPDTHALLLRISHECLDGMPHAPPEQVRRAVTRCCPKAWRGPSLPLAVALAVNGAKSTRAGL